VIDASIPEKPKTSLDNVKIPPGETIEKTVEFSQEGRLKVEAIKDGESIHVYTRIYEGDDKVASGWLKEGKGRTFKLLPGTYRIELWDKSIPQEPKKVLKNIEVKSGILVSHQAYFAQEGELKVQAIKDGRSIHLYTRIYDGDDRVAFGWLNEGEGKTFKLLPGTYRVEIKGADGKKKDQEGVKVQSGELSEVSIQF
jgi:hypothetical protein